ncbi:MAG: hypothetical protein ACREPE_01940, partial [Lysobacter sp.]
MNSEAMVVASADMTAVPPAPMSMPTPRSALYATPPQFVTPLRVVLVAPRQLPAWLLRFFELVPENHWLDLVVLPIGDERSAPRVTLPVDLRALLAYEHRRPITACVDPVAIGSHANVQFESPVRSDLDIAPLRASISALRPDLILLLGAPQWAEALGDRAQWGCWDFDSSITDSGRAAQALLAPVMRGEVATAAELQLHHLDRPPTTLAASWGSTCRASASVQREQVFRKIPALLMRSLRLLANGELQVPTQRTARLQLTAAQLPAGFGAGLRTLASTLAFRFTTRRRRSQPLEAPWQIVIRHGAEPIDP